MLYVYEYDDYLFDMIIAITFDINEQRSFDVSILLLFLCLAFLC